MPEEQKYIYFASGENRQRLAAKLPQLEKLGEKGFDVLLMTDEVDSCRKLFMIMMQMARLRCC